MMGTKESVSGVSAPVVLALWVGVGIGIVGWVLWYWVLWHCFGIGIVGVGFGIVGVGIGIVGWVLWYWVGVGYCGIVGWVLWYWVGVGIVGCGPAGRPFSLE
eukprot:1126143-Pelagomonas_calceolata.AAC.1